MRKKIILPIILSIVAVMFIAIGISKSFAFDIVSNPTIQQGYNPKYPLDGGSVGFYISNSFSGYVDITFNNPVQTLNLKNNSGDVLFSYNPPGGDWCTDYFSTATENGTNGKISPLVNVIKNRYVIIQCDMVSGSVYNNRNTLMYDYISSTLSIIDSFKGGTSGLQLPNAWNNTGNNPMFGDDYIFIQSGDNIKIFDYVGNLLSTVPEPSVNFGVKWGRFPIYLEGLNGTHFFAYQGTDGKSYKVLDTFASGTDLPIESAGTGSVLPLGKFGYNDLILSRLVLGSGSLYIGDGATALPQLELSTGSMIKIFGVFENPKIYFRNSLNVIKSWDMNCMTSGYDSCVLNSGVFKCANESGTLSPGGELCGGTVDVGPPPSCTDGIKNQDETGVDFGGTCGGTDTFIHEGPYEENFLCTNVNVVNPPTTGSGYDFGTLASVSEDHFYASTWTFDFYSGSTEEDYFEATGLGSGSLIYSGSLKSLDAGITSTLLPLDPSSQYSIQLNMFSIRNDEYRKVGYIAFKTGKNTQNQGSITFINENREEQRTYLVGIGNGVAMGYVVGDFIPKEAKLTGLASPFVFSGMEIGYASETYTQAPQCDNTEWSCKVTGKLGEYCTAQYYPGNARGTCGFVDGYCQPTTSLEDADWSYVGSGTGVTSNYTATSTGDSVNSSFSFSFGTLPGVGTGTDCSDMFDGLRFLYGSKSTTTMTLALSNGFKLSETPWTCSFLGADICGVAYDTSDYIVGSMFSAIDSTVNYLFTPVRMGIGYFSKPVQGDRYCFLTSSFTYDGKPATYYDYYLKETVTIGGQNTAFDWVVILIVTSVIFIILFK